LLTVYCLLSSDTFALGPHEVLLLANRNSPRSLALARDYAALRHIPEVNLVALDLPASPACEMTPADFTAKIWNPARQALLDRGLSDHILAWVYSVDFPIRITATPALSLQGLTFLKGKMPDKEQVERGSYASPIFAGPETPRISGFPAQSLDVQSAWLGQDMPVPSMMLGYMGPNGNTPEEIMACLKNGVQSDQTRPGGTVLILTNSDIRTLARAWEFELAKNELEAQEIAVIIAPTPPSTKGEPTKLCGLMAGAADLPEIARHKFLFRPGAIAEHLTSFGAAFDNNGQTKITEWIRAGATASAGTVTEPLSIWMKFPHARVFSLQAAGCTILESLIQSIRCPLQILLIGEPLASPWAPRSNVSIQGLKEGKLDKKTVITAEISARDGEVFNRFMFLLDGKTLQPLGKSPSATLDPAPTTHGRHTVRVIAYKVGTVRSQIFSETSFEVK
ncbi:MAG: TIGR03790 family protein, partial [bacterium]